MFCFRLAFLLTIVLATALALSPPGFPGNEIKLEFIAQDGSTLDGETALLTLTDSSSEYEMAVIINGSQGALLFPRAPGVVSMEARIDIPATPALDYISEPIRAPSGAAELRMFPVGEVVGVVIGENNTAVQTTVSFSCASPQPVVPPVETDSRGRFSAVLPVGQCTLSAALGGATGEAAVDVRRGEVSEAVLRLAVPPSTGASYSAFLPYLLLFAILLGAVLWFFYMRKPPTVKPRGKRKKLVAALLLIALAGAAHSASLSNNTPSSSHAYDTQAALGYIPNARSLVVSGSLAVPCAGKVFFELGNSGENYVEIGSAELVGDSFALSVRGAGPKRFYRLRAPGCTLANSSITITEMPDLTISSLRVVSSDPSGAIRTGVPAKVIVTAYNHGGAFTGEGELVLSYYEGAADEAHKFGELRLNRSEDVWGERGSTLVETFWIPAKVGTRTIYVTIDDRPDAEGEEADEDNNMASIGVYVQPGPSEQRATDATLSLTPASGEAGSASPVSIIVRYVDRQTAQPLPGASCVLTSQLSNATLSPSADGSSYTASVDISSIAVGVYRLEATCSKSGYAPASAAAVLPIISPNGSLVYLARDTRLARGSLLVSRQALGPMHTLRVRLERYGEEDIGVSKDSVRMNTYPASHFSTDAEYSGGLAWLSSGTYAEWSFDAENIPDEIIELVFEPAVLGRSGLPASTHANVVLTPIELTCFRRRAELQLVPSEQRGEVGTGMPYLLSILNRNEEGCGLSTFRLTPSKVRKGWLYEPLSSELSILPGGRNFTFITVTPPIGEQPGTYRFRISAEDTAEPGTPGFEQTAVAEATYIVTSAQLFAELEAWAEPQPVSPAPGASVTVFARYYNLSNQSMGECSVASQLLSSNSLPMRFDGTLHSLTIDVSDAEPGTYPFLVSCSEPGYRSRSVGGNITISQPTTPRRLPKLTANPVYQLSTGAGATFALALHNREACNGTRTFLLDARVPLLSDALDVPCLGERIVLITVPPLPSPGMGAEEVSVYYSDSPSYNASTFLLTAFPRPGEGASVLSCAAGDALESRENSMRWGDPCGRYQTAHTYEATGAVSASAFALATGCPSPPVLEASSDGSAYLPLVQLRQKNGVYLSPIANLSGQRFLRVTAPGCALRESAVMIGRPLSPLPDLRVASISLDFRPRAGSVTRSRVAIFNDGQTTYDTYTVGLELVAPDGERTPLGFRNIFSHASGTAQEVEIPFTPPTPGTYSLVATADFVNDVNESDEANNQLSISRIEVLPHAQNATSLRLPPGWSVVPMLRGASAETSCEEAFAWLPRTQGLLALFPANLQTPAAIGGEEFAFTGAWVFSSGSCTANYTVSSLPASSEMVLYPGENLVPVLPWMEENTLANVFGDCVREAYAWDGLSQSWEGLPLETPIRPGSFGRVLLVRSDSQCRPR